MQINVGIAVVVTVGAVVDALSMWIPVSFWGEGGAFEERIISRGKAIKENEMKRGPTVVSRHCKRHSKFEQWPRVAGEILTLFQEINYLRNGNGARIHLPFRHLVIPCGTRIDEFNFDLQSFTYPFRCSRSVALLTPNNLWSEPQLPTVCAFREKQLPTMTSVRKGFSDTRIV